MFPPVQYSSAGYLSHSLRYALVLAAALSGGCSIARAQSVTADAGDVRPNAGMLRHPCWVFEPMAWTRICSISPGGRCDREYSSSSSHLPRKRSIWHALA